MAFERILFLCCVIFLGIAQSLVVPPQNETKNHPDSNASTTSIPTNETIITPQPTTDKNHPASDATITATNIDETTTVFQETTEDATEKLQNGSEKYQNSNDSTTSTTTIRTITTHIWAARNFDYLLLNETTNVPCILTKMNITLTIPYKTKQNKIDTKKITVPFNANVTGTCKEDISVLTLMWQESAELGVSISNGINELTMNIVKDGDIHYVQYVILSIVLDDVHFPDAAEPVMKGNSTNNLMLFKTSEPNSIYVCNDAQEIQTGDMIVIIDNIQFIAFNTDANSTLNRKEEYCPAVKEPKMKTENVGIIVGGILIALVCITLIIFIINRYSKKITSWNISRAHTGMKGL